MATKTRNQLSCKLLRKPIWPCELLPEGEPGEVEINGQVYDLAVNADLPEHGEPVTYGFRLTNRESERVYDVDCSSQWLTCDCADATYNDPAGGCKHSRAIRDLRERGEI